MVQKNFSIKNNFKKHYYNPAVCLLFRFMHDMDKPLGVEQDQLDDIVSTKSIASTCPECEQNINSTRYRWGNMTRVINSDILKTKIMMMIQFLYKQKTCVIFQNGNKYTTRLIITELKKSDRDQTGTVYVHNQRGGANYTYTLSNLEGELFFFYQKIKEMLILAFETKSGTTAVLNGTFFTFSQITAISKMYW